jgi:hypothetical protein
MRSAALKPVFMAQIVPGRSRDGRRFGEHGAAHARRIPGSGAQLLDVELLDLSHIKARCSIDKLIMRLAVRSRSSASSGVMLPSNRLVVVALGTFLAILCRLPLSFLNL